MGLLSALLLLQALAAPPPPKDLDAEVAAVMAQWTGDYRSAAGDPPRVAVVRPIAVPRLGRRAMFVEVRDGGADGRILLQRIIVFADAPGRTRNWAASWYFPDPAPHARLDRRPAEAAALGPADISVFDPTPGGCALNLFPEDGGYVLSARKEQCRIVSRMTPGLVFHPEFRLTIGNGRFGFFEQGFFDNGAPAAPALSYTLAKVR